MDRVRQLFTEVHRSGIRWAAADSGGSPKRAAADSGGSPKRTAALKGAPE